MVGVLCTMDGFGIRRPRESPRRAQVRNSRIGMDRYGLIGISINRPVALAAVGPWGGSASCGALLLIHLSPDRRTSHSAALRSGWRTEAPCSARSGPTPQLDGSPADLPRRRPPAVALRRRFAPGARARISAS